MSHPDPSHDQENERPDDDLLRDEIDAQRWWDAEDMKAELKPDWASYWAKREQDHREHIRWLREFLKPIGVIK